MLISLIIPVYNSELQIEKCLRSCAEQDILTKEFEIIVVNDGSFDNSLNIINYVSKDYSNFIIIDKPNGGVSSARNAGIEKAKGKYIWFVDSDDSIKKEALFIIKKILLKDDLDMLQIGYYISTNEFTIANDKKYFLSTVVMSPDQYISLDYFIGGACMSIIKGDLIHNNNIKFDTSLNLAEDQIFMLTVLNYSNRVKRIIDLLYYYYTNPLGAIHNPKQVDILSSINKISNFEFNERFKIYCDKLIIQQFLISCKQTNFKIKELDTLFKKSNIASLTLHDYISNSKKSKVFFLFYNSLGLPFLIIFLGLNNLKISLLSLFKRIS